MRKEDFLFQADQVLVQIKRLQDTLDTLNPDCWNYVDAWVALVDAKRAIYDAKESVNG